MDGRTHLLRAERRTGRLGEPVRSAVPGGGGRGSRSRHADHPVG
ncbi:hypothetical protein N136_04241 [Leifsonia aquatica ATCC 14665]|uniref:Uncharacterized protein n=1 Tax=Leifsonia aquatica ATCC 14665 TaxID=1358026 RepID=U2RLL5_LEIAQ|nr:hypothetical protein N136_04241 [Leifsonia aquatica ATCC 14665]